MRRAGWIGAAAGVLSGRVAGACTVCDSPVGHAVRAGIFNGHFLRNAVLMGAPFPVFLAAGLWIYFKLPVGGEAAGFATARETR